MRKYPAQAWIDAFPAHLRRMIRDNSTGYLSVNGIADIDKWLREHTYAYAHQALGDLFEYRNTTQGYEYWANIRAQVYAVTPPYALMTIWFPHPYPKNEKPAHISAETIRYLQL